MHRSFKSSKHLFALVPLGFPEIFADGAAIGNPLFSGKINDKFIKDKPISPGLKYRHYAPKGEMIILKSDLYSLHTLKSPYLLYVQSKDYLFPYA